MTTLFKFLLLSVAALVAVVVSSMGSYGFHAKLSVAFKINGEGVMEESQRRQPIFKLAAVQFELSADKDPKQ